MGRSNTAVLAEAAEAALDRSVAGITRCAGGDINRAFRLELESGDLAFLKCRAGASVDEFVDEAAGLAWLAEPGAIPVPRVLALVESEACPGLILEWMEAGRGLSGSGEQELGRGLAEIHLSGADFHGQRPPGTSGGGIRLGEALLVGPRDERVEHPEGRPELSFAELYATRIEALAGQAVTAGGLDRHGAAVISLLAEQIDRFAGPPVPPARLHGDLWSGNVLADRSGRPWLIDPAPYGGHPEVDLAMLDLFGSLSPEFMGGYEEVLPLPEGAQERRQLWQVQPLLVHAVLFGGQYGAAAMGAAGQYTGG